MKRRKKGFKHCVNYFKQERRKFISLFSFALIVGILYTYLTFYSFGSIQSTIMVIFIMLIFIYTAYKHTRSLGFRIAFNCVFKIIIDICLFLILLDFLSNTESTYLSGLYSTVFQSQIFSFFVVLAILASYNSIIEILGKYNINLLKNLKPKKFNTHFIYFAILLVELLILYVILAIAEMSAVENLVEILKTIASFVFVIVNSYIVICYIPITKELNIPVSLQNLDMFDVYSSPIYTLNKIKSNRDTRIFRFDFSSLFPEGVSDRDLYIVNQDFIKTNAYKRSDIDYLYLCVDNNHAKDTVHVLKITLKWRLGKKISFVNLDLYLRFESISNEVILSKSLVFNFHKKYVSIFNGNGYEQSIELLNIFKRNYLCCTDVDTNRKSTNIFALNSSMDTRKWMFHNGKFGCGKSTLDILKTFEGGFVPVLVSPWEDHYDNDIMYLIFDRLVTQTKTKFFFPKKSVSIFIITALVAFSYFVLKISTYLLEMVIHYAFIMDIGVFLESFALSKKINIIYT